MKKNWNNPELKNLAVECTNEGQECCEVPVGATIDGDHELFNKCHHGLKVNGWPANHTNCGHSYVKREDCFKIVIGCNYVSKS